ncbi:AAA family ATPase [Pseudogulbenkiania sp. MAI-1]|uniref:AAA family ATPase n=1 Tax=Pseudogulbenkiania sp. MAI-1 TaxID=990370 RepID=UPI00045E7FBF|nr:AAA family ATPase [Pseudogulbenkiania sp. MAI-1]
MSTSTFFSRAQLARQMADQLLNPGILDANLRSGLFLSGQRRTGKTTFLKQDLIPILEERGAIVIYVDLWSDPQANPATLVHNAIKSKLQELETPGSSLLAKLKRLKGIDLGAAGFKLGISLDSLGTEKGATLASAFCHVVDQAHTDVVIIVDEVQHAISTDEGNRMLTAMKAARDAVNGRENTPGHFLFIGTGSHRAKVQELVINRNQAFLGASSVDFPLLGRDYVEFLRQRLEEAHYPNLPALDVMVAGFETLGHRPEELMKALRQVIQLQPGQDADVFFPIITQTLKSSLADVEISKLEQLGSLAMVVFDRIAKSRSGVKGLYSAEALTSYQEELGMDVSTSEVQQILNTLYAENLVMRSGHGSYCVSDPYVQKLWEERKALASI